MVREPLQLPAVDLSTGAQVWSQPIRDTVDHEPRDKRAACPPVEGRAAWTGDGRNRRVNKWISTLAS